MLIKMLKNNCIFIRYKNGTIQIDIRFSCMILRIMFVVCQLNTSIMTLLLCHVYVYVVHFCEHMWSFELKRVVLFLVYFC
jgi:hypothetical protein